MQTIYTTTTHFVRRSGNVVDFQDYRRRLALTQEGSLAPNPREEASRWTEDWTEEPREEVVSYTHLLPLHAAPH